MEREKSEGLERKQEIFKAVNRLGQATTYMYRPLKVTQNNIHIKPATNINRKVIQQNIYTLPEVDNNMEIESSNVISFNIIVWYTNIFAETCFQIEKRPRNIDTGQ